MSLDLGDIALLTATAPAKKPVTRPPQRCAGGAPHGERHGKSKISDQQVRRIRQLRADEGLGYKALAERFSCSWETARDIVKGKTRMSAGGPIEGEP